MDYFMECDCKITAAPEHNRLEPCAAHLEWMKALVRAEREECAMIADVHASKYPFGTTHQDQAYASGVERASEAIADAIRARGQPST